MSSTSCTSSANLSVYLLANQIKLPTTVLGLVINKRDILIRNILIQIHCRVMFIYQLIISHIYVLSE